MNHQKSYKCNKSSWWINTVHGPLSSNSLYLESASCNGVELSRGMGRWNCIAHFSKVLNRFVFRDIPTEDLIYPQSFPN